MKKSYVIVENRRKQLLQELKEQKTVEILALAKQMNVSPLTIRRDLEHFEQSGLIERFYGGAKLIADKEGSVTFDDSNTSAQKHAIAKRAAQLVADKDTIFINTSSTALLMLNYLTANRVTVITNNGKAIFCNTKNDLMVVLTGGELRSPKEAMVGDFALNNLSKVMATKSFIGCGGLTVEDGITTSIFAEASVNAMMLERVSMKRYILADHTKIGKVQSFVSAPIDKIDCLITDTAANQEVLTALQNKNIEVIQVDPFDQGTQ